MKERPQQQPRRPKVRQPRAQQVQFAQRRRQVARQQQRARIRDDDALQLRQRLEQLRGTQSKQAST